MKRTTVFLISLIAVLLLAGLCACKQELSQEETQSTIPKWDKSDDGLQNLPDINTSGTRTGVTEALLDGLNNPPSFTGAKNVIVMVCEGLTAEMIEESTSQYGELILNSFQIKGNTSSRFTNDSGKTLADYLINTLYKLKTGIVAWGETSTNSLRRMTTTCGNELERAAVNYEQFMLSPPLVYIMGKGDFTDAIAYDSLNMMYKEGGKKTATLEDSIPLYKNDEVVFSAVGHDTYKTRVAKLYTIFEDDSTLPSFRQEMAFSLAWMQSVMHYRDGFALLASYSPSSALDAAGVQDFDEGVAIAVKFVLENPDTVLLICGCPVDGSSATVPFYGLGKGVLAQNTLFECVSSLYSE